MVPRMTGKGAAPAEVTANCLAPAPSWLTLSEHVVAQRALDPGGRGALFF